MTRLRVALCAAIALMTTSCATEYGARGFAGGYSDEKIDETHYRVRFDGNGYAGKDRVWAFWMYRCAELTRAKGYAFFTIQRAGEKVGQAPSGPAMRHAVYAIGEAPLLIQTKGNYTYVPIYVPGGKVTSWSSDAVVAMFKDPLPEDLWVLNADAVTQALEGFVKTNGARGAVDREDVFRRAVTIKRGDRGYSFGGPL